MPRKTKSENNETEEDVKVTTKVTDDEGSDGDSGSKPTKRGGRRTTKQDSKKSVKKEESSDEKETDDKQPEVTKEAEAEAEPEVKPEDNKEDGENSGEFDYNEIRKITTPLNEVDLKTLIKATIVKGSDEQNPLAYGLATKLHRRLLNNGDKSGSYQPGNYKKQGNFRGPSSGPFRGGRDSDSFRGGRREFSGYSRGPRRDFNGGDRSDRRDFNDGGDRRTFDNNRYSGKPRDDESGDKDGDKEHSDENTSRQSSYRSSNFGRGGRGGGRDFESRGPNTSYGGRNYEKYDNRRDTRNYDRDTSDRKPPVDGDDDKKEKRSIKRQV